VSESKRSGCPSLQRILAEPQMEAESGFETLSQIYVYARQYDYVICLEPQVYKI
jgi:hypothetical protein